jgi:hypothetical protein
MMPSSLVILFASTSFLMMMSKADSWTNRVVAFYGQHYGRQSVLDAYRQMSRTEEARASACEFLLVDGDCASALIRLTNADIGPAMKTASASLISPVSAAARVSTIAASPIVLGRLNKLSGARSM